MADDTEKPKKQSFLGRVSKGIGNALLEQPKTPQVQTEPQSPGKVVTPNPDIFLTQQNVSAEPVNQEMLATLRERITPNDSLLENFLETLKRLETVLVDPVSRLKAAVAASGIDVNSLEVEIDTTLAKIPGERELVNQKADALIAEINKQNESRFSELASQIASKESTITALEGEIRQLEAERKGIKASSSEEIAAKENTRKAFLKAADLVATELNTIRIQLNGLNQ